MSLLDAVHWGEVIPTKVLL